MKKIIIILFLGILALGCSTSEDDNTTNVKSKLVIDGIELTSPDLAYIVAKQGDLMILTATVGDYSYTDAVFDLRLVFSTTGKFISGALVFNSVSSGHPVYKNFLHFPSNYFQVIDFNFDEAHKRIKIKFACKLYNNNESLTSEAKDIQGELDMEYVDYETDNEPLVINYVEQYCRADFNSTPWSARFEYNFSSFTNEDAYKIEIHFINAPTPGSFSFDSASTDNYVRLSKFNPQTLTYDYYNVSGQVGYTYREYHGFTYYSFIGTFSFTAVNLNNPSDVIQVTNGEFRSYQQF